MFVLALLSMLLAVATASVPAPVIAAAPVAIPAPFVTARSYQAFHRNYNTYAAAPVIAAAAPLSYAPSAPLAYASAPGPITYAAGPVPFGSSPLAYAAPSPVAAPVPGPFIFRR